LSWSFFVCEKVVYAIAVSPVVLFPLTPALSHTAWGQVFPLPGGEGLGEGIYYILNSPLSHPSYRIYGTTSVSYKKLTLPTQFVGCRTRWSPEH
ncbi:hypothetical protein, partial [Enterobacter intestinihominis]